MGINAKEIAIDVGPRHLARGERGERKHENADDGGMPEGEVAELFEPKPDRTVMREPTAEAGGEVARSQ
jgi:hypothetical protein